MEQTTGVSSELRVNELCVTELCVTELCVIDGVFCVSVLVLIAGGVMVGYGISQNQNDFVAGGALAFAIACVVMCLVVIFIFR